MADHARKTQTSQAIALYFALFRLEIIQRFVDGGSVVSREGNIGCFMEARSAGFLGFIPRDALTDVIDGHAVRNAIEPGPQRSRGKRTCCLVRWEQH